MGAWAPLLHGRGGGPLLGIPEGSFSPTGNTRGSASSSFSRRTIVVRNGGAGPGSATPPASRARAAGASSSSANGETEWPEKKKKAATTATTQKQQQRRQTPSVLEVQRAIGVASGGDDGGGTRDDGGNRPASVLDFFASTPIGQAESPAERKLREAAEWVVERTESRGLFGQRIMMVVGLYILPVWVFLLLVASGAIKLPFSLPFIDDLLS